VHSAQGVEVAHVDNERFMYHVEESGYEMQCLEPISIRNPKGQSAADRITVPCGKCAACLQNRRGEWTTRLKIELEDAKSAFFITLTYNEDHLAYGEGGPSLVKSDLQKFLKRLRKSIEPHKIRYYAVGEYGTRTARPHYHIILFNIPVNQIDNVRQAWCDKQGQEIGHIDVGTVTGGSIHYVTKYHINKNTSPDGVQPSFCIMSRHPAIGHRYVEKYGVNHRNRVDRAYIFERGGEKLRLPRIYKDKLYSSFQREKIRKLNEKRLDQIDETEKIEEHYRNNPDINYYYYKDLQKENFQKTSKIKTNKLNKL